MTDSDSRQRCCDHYHRERYPHLEKRKFGGEEADAVIVGLGAAGGVLLYELAKAGLDVVGIEAGPFWDPQSDFASDELHAQTLAWNDTRLSTGQNALQFGANNSGRGVGGGTVHFTGVFYRFHESDFRVRTLDGTAEDWPISYEDLAPYYDKIENEIKVSGPREFPWGPFHGPYPYPERSPISGNAEIFRRGCEALGIRSTTAPLAILSAPFDARPPCINRGFCNQGCLPNAKFSTLIHHVPKAIALGAEVLSDSMVTRILVDQRGRVSGVEFNHDGRYYEQKAKVVIVSAFAVETPRLLLNSACSQFPDGLANSSGLVGKYLMPHSGHDVYARFDQEIRLYWDTRLGSQPRLLRNRSKPGFHPRLLPPCPRQQAPGDGGEGGNQCRDLGQAPAGDHAPLELLRPHHPSGGGAAGDHQLRYPERRDRRIRAAQGRGALCLRGKRSEADQPRHPKMPRDPGGSRRKGRLCGARQRAPHGRLPHGR